MSLKRFLIKGIFNICFLSMLVSFYFKVDTKQSNSTTPITKNKALLLQNFVNSSMIESTDSLPKIIKGNSLKMVKGRIGYDLGGRQINTQHFALRVTTPKNPFKPHKHEQPELWYIIKGKATVSLNGVAYEVEENDLVVLDPWVEHGLSTTGEVTWICLG